MHRKTLLTATKYILTHTFIYFKQRCWYLQSYRSWSTCIRQHICEGISSTKAQTMNQIPLNSIKLYQKVFRMLCWWQCRSILIPGVFLNYVCSFFKLCSPKKNFENKHKTQVSYEVLQQGHSTDRSNYHIIPTICPLEGPQMKTYCYSLSGILWLTQALQENVWAFSTEGHRC